VTLVLEGEALAVHVCCRIEVSLEQHGAPKGLLFEWSCSRGWVQFLRPACGILFGVIDCDYGGMGQMKINVMTNVLEANDRIAAANREIFTTLLEAKVLIENWRKEYNQVRPHSSLGYRPPTPEAIQLFYTPATLTLEVVQ